LLGTVSLREFPEIGIGVGAAATLEHGLFTSRVEGFVFLLYSNTFGVPVF